ncbi:hypothetical protein RKE30_04275 [Streptomyces sp. Li-HN-5-11]|uniref:hypothetical protein n=1 Tax=Streptomyces sp. Li-HN-5-11 TaxID=3075432 RepID=UPI0028A93571|nr:hypothetical protein [Streptomyces sp. Li-HN-5-11]WNM29668.1 hypothetical protein RKE30_04275 [Streptomyces sp. Li-HN-5-11]
MPATESNSAHPVQRQPWPAARPKARPYPGPYMTAGLSMRDLLASCAAAEAVSRPPRAPEPEGPQDARAVTRTVDDRREAA